ncbi:MAG: hypothetical protein ACJAYM_001997 [Flavobacteriales bacterium]
MIGILSSLVFIVAALFECLTALCIREIADKVKLQSANA